MITSLEIDTRAIGNSLFIFATLFGVGKKLNLDIRLSTGENHIHQPTGQHIIQLKNIFDITVPDITQEEINGITNKYIEKCKEFNPEIFDEVKDNTNLIGFFQSEKYFDFCADELRQQLKFKDKWIDIARRGFIGSGFLPKDCISIHIRRGDYTLPHLQPFHPVLPNTYYNDALSYIEKYISDNKLETPKRVLVFSDDLDFCKATFGDSDVFYVVDNTEYKEYCAVIDLCMMSMCQYYIIANSSFSFWGAWLGNPNQDKLTIAPNLWFGNGYGFGGKHIPSEKWVKL